MVHIDSLFCPYPSSFLHPICSANAATVAWAQQAGAGSLCPHFGTMCDDVLLGLYSNYGKEMERTGGIGVT